MELSVNYLGDVAFEVAVRGHRVVCDQPETNGGKDAGMSPPEFLLASLATCAGFYAAQYLRTRSLPTEGLKVRVVAEKGGTPVHLNKFQIEVSVPPLDDRHRQGVLRAVETCLVHRTLQHTPEIQITLT
jgi:putative redox protein